jgi:hypothetical protein
MKPIWKACVAALGAALAAPVANAALITSLQGTVIDFDEGGVQLGQPNGPVQVGTSEGIFVEVSSVGGPLSVGEAPFGAWGLGSNGEWSLGKTFAGVDADVDPVDGAPALVFDFGTERWARVGAFINFYPDTLGFFGPEPLSIHAFDENGVELDSYFVPIVTPDEINGGAFFGIALAEATIAKFVVYGPYAAVDDLTVAPIPEPSSYALMLVGVGMLGWLLRRRNVA